jgi:hypothetical protein
MDWWRHNVGAYSYLQVSPLRADSSQRVRIARILTYKEKMDSRILRWPTHPWPVDNPMRFWACFDSAQYDIL